MNDSDSKKPRKLLPSTGEIDVHFMKRALVLAREAGKLGEVPVGAVLVLNRENSSTSNMSNSNNSSVSNSKNKKNTKNNLLSYSENSTDNSGTNVSVSSIVGEGQNCRETGADPLGHAELIAIAKGAAALGRWRLSDCTLYVTLEPCVMCAGAMVQSRVGRLVYGAHDLKGGAIASLYSIASDARLNHQFEFTSGVCESECSKLLTEFFVQLRWQKKHEKPPRG